MAPHPRWDQDMTSGALRSISGVDTATTAPDVLVHGMTGWRLGFTTGTCAAAAAKAATMAVCSGARPADVEVALPGGERVRIPIEQVDAGPGLGEAAVRKDGGDDPDVTSGLLVLARVELTGGTNVEFRAGPGVGTVRLPGLAVEPGHPAINPMPRRQIAAAVRDVTDEGVSITLSIPGGEQIAARTFNPRLGVSGGLSILGTDGRVRPFSSKRLIDALVLGVDVARASGVLSPVLVPGHLGRRHALASLRCSEGRVIDVSNEFGAMLERCAARGMHSALLLGHPGKLAKLAAGEFDTHSSRSQPAVRSIAAIAGQLRLTVDEAIPTAEGVFGSLGPSERHKLGCAVAAAIREAAERRVPALALAVWLTDLAGNQLGTAGDLSPWNR